MTHHCARVPLWMFLLRFYVVTATRSTAFAPPLLVSPILSPRLRKGRPSCRPVLGLPRHDLDALFSDQTHQTLHRRIVLRNQRNDNSNDEEQSNPNWLDEPFFDPNDDDSIKNPIVKWFASLVLNDYEMAEALYVGVIMVVAIVATQELLRMQLYGDSYIPFVKGGAAGSSGVLWE